MAYNRGYALFIIVAAAAWRGIEESQCMDSLQGISCACLDNHGRTGCMCHRSGPPFRIVAESLPRFACHWKSPA